MLEYLRKNASSLFSKLLLGGIALIFALYFGFSGGGAPQGGTAPIAKVNGENIPVGYFNANVQAQLSFYQQLGQDTASAELQKVLESQVLQNLINNMLYSQEAKTLGLHISDVELAEAIRSNPNFQRNGQFDEQFYLKQFKPYYQRQNGQDYEFTLREEMLQNRLREALDQAALVSQSEMEDNLLVQDTLVTLRTLEIPVDGEAGQKNSEEALQIARQWIEAKSAGQSTQPILKEHGLSESEDGSKSLYVLQNFFGGEDSLPILLCLFKLKPGEVCQEPFRVQNKILAVELLEMKSAQSEEAKLNRVKEQLKQAKKRQILNGVSQLLTQDAKIETFLQN